jgi:hypothetical protein
VVWRGCLFELSVDHEGVRDLIGKESAQLGSTTVRPPTELAGGSTVALFADLEGHVVGLEI